ncbi:MAG TPA: DUF3862 domain-containing protein [Pyrinomonadaceae bacterium]|jgi:hypothetical protein
MQTYNQEPERKVSFLLGLGIFLMPYIFSWFTLRKGHTTTAKIISFVWLGVIVLMVAIKPNQDISDSSRAFVSDTRQTKDSSSGKITMSKFDRLEIGMSYSQASSILGKSGTKMSENKFGNVRTEMYQWECGFMCLVHLYFSNGELTQKVQTGLE